MVFSLDTQKAQQPATVVEAEAPEIKPSTGSKKVHPTEKEENEGSWVAQS